MLDYTSSNNFSSSPMEGLLVRTFKNCKIVYVREVMFADCVNPKTGQQLRFDFYLPEYNILVEYDGKFFHKSAEVKARDRVKTSFARKNKIKLVRLSGRASIVRFFKNHLNSVIVDKRKK